MVRRGLSFALPGVAFVALLSGCALGRMSGMNPRPAGQPVEKRQVAITASEEQRAGVRARERQALEQKVQARRADFLRDSMEQNARNAIALTLGQRAAASESASSSIKALHASGIRLRVDATREPFQLVAETEDSPRPARKRPAKKETEKGAEAPPPSAEGLGQQLAAVSRSAKWWNDHVQLDGLQYIGPVASMVLSRKKMGFDFEDGDYEVVRSYLEMARADEAIAASMLALLATYQAAIDGADAKAIDTVAESTSQAFPIRAAVTLDDAKAYVAELRGPIAKLKARYEAALRKSVGNEPYEKAFKARVDAAFPAFVDVVPVRPVGSELAGKLTKVDTRVLEDAQRCKSGARCEDPRRPSKLGDSAHAASASKDTGLPGGAAITASIDGMRAIKSGDAKGAFAGAIALQPVPALKRVFAETSSASSH